MLNLSDDLFPGCLVNMLSQSIIQYVTVDQKLYLLIGTECNFKAKRSS